MKEVCQEEDVKSTVAGLSIVLFSRSDVVGLFFPRLVRFWDIRREETSQRTSTLARLTPHWSNREN